MDQQAGRPYWKLMFDQTGRLTAPDRDQFLEEVARSELAELFVFSHGWGNSQQDAQDLYDAMFPLIATTAGQSPGLGPIGFVGVFWPSLWFPDPPPAAAAEVAAAVAADQPGAADAALSGQQIADTLQKSFDDPGQKAQVDRMGQLIDEGVAATGSEPAATQQQRLTEFHSLLQTLVGNGNQAVEDSGENTLLRSTDPQSDYAWISDLLGSTPPSGAAEDLADIFAKVWNGAKDALRSGSYYEMKARAGQVGTNGLGPLLEQLHRKAPTVRVHLLGHSFGARLVAFALKGISSAGASPVASLLLIQGAFSHWSFAHEQDMPFGTAGALNEYSDRVHGPLVATFSEHDWAVGRWYPKASFLAQQNASNDVDPASQWGGMGSDGFQGVTPQAPLDLVPAGQPYSFAASSFYRVNAGAVIADTGQSPFSGAHSDIRHREVAWLIVSAAATAPS
jgi:hypothetical protein